MSPNNINTAQKQQRLEEETAVDSLFVVWTALIGNSLIMVTKFIVAFLSGSVSMMAEAVHSVADSSNQLFLILSIKLGAKPADEKHPFGYGKERFFWAFVAALVIFFVGAFFSIFEGIKKIIEGQHGGGQSFFVLTIIVLSVAIVFEAISMGFAIKEVRHGMEKAKKGVVDFISQTRDLTLKTVLFEDGAALLGLMFAAIGTYFSYIYESTFYDGIASVIIGIILAVVAVFLAKEARTLLLGAAAGKEDLKIIRKIFLSEPKVEKIVDLLSMYIGPESILLTSHLQISGKLSANDQELLIDKLEKKIISKVPLVKKVFIEPESIKHRHKEIDL